MSKIVKTYDYYTLDQARTIINEEYRQKWLRRQNQWMLAKKRRRNKLIRKIIYQVFLILGIGLIGISIITWNFACFVMGLFFLLILI